MQRAGQSHALVGVLLTGWCLLTGACAFTSPLCSFLPIELPDSAQASPEGEATLAVIGVQLAQSKDVCRELACQHDPGIGVGLRARLTQALAYTRRFRLLREQALQQRVLTEHGFSQFSLSPQVAYTDQQMQEVATQLHVDYLAYGRLTQSTIIESRTESVLSFVRTTLYVTVLVCLYERRTDTQHCQEGEGKTSQAGTATILDLQSAGQDLVKNVPSCALVQAIEAAVAKLAPVLPRQATFS